MTLPFQAAVESPDHIRKNRAGWNAGSDAYEAKHSSQLARTPMGWGTYAIPEERLRVLGAVAGKDMLEFGCGAARWSIALAEQGAHSVGMDLSEKQLRHAGREVGGSGASVALVQADAERTPFRAQSFDIVFCDRGATTFSDPQRTVPEAARLLRAGGLFVFNISSPVRELSTDPATDQVTDCLHRDYFSLHRLEWEDEVSFQLGYGDWIRLFVGCGLQVEDLIELRPDEDSETTYADYVPKEWARRWPAENIWKLRKT